MDNPVQSRREPGVLDPDIIPLVLEGIVVRAGGNAVLSRRAMALGG